MIFFLVLGFELVLTWQALKHLSHAPSSKCFKKKFSEMFKTFSPPFRKMEFCVCAGY
jgi:hypothetical protein